ncbi:MAG: hypothetical protein JWL93_1850 [Hyphomicrobiales bacterium]|nr:hypothetical protein [Hyphomicrobiales bacterium]
MRKLISVISLAVAGAVLASAPALAQRYESDTVYRERYAPQYRVEPRRYEERRGPPMARGIDRREAVAIAQSAGMDRVVRISGASGDVWRLTGLNGRGREVRMVIDGRTGRIIARERE